MFLALGPASILLIVAWSHALCASTVDVGSDGGMLEVTMSPDVDEGTSLDAEEEGPRSVSGSVDVVAKLLQSLPTARVWAALDGTIDIHGGRAEVPALVAAGWLVALAPSETTVTVGPCVVPASTSLQAQLSQGVLLMPLRMKLSLEWSPQLVQL
jgi:hypothetical protein